MTKKNLYSSLVVATVLLLLACSGMKSQSVKTSDAKNTKPNIILIVADDLGYADVGFNGSKDIITPELDKLAKAGTVCSSAYVAHPFCGPSRAGLLTGRYPHEFGSQFNLPANSEKSVGQGIPLSEKFLSATLKESGYYTGIIGKWHLGAVAGYEPKDRGFDDFYGFLGGGHNYFPEDYQAKYKQQLAAGNKNIWEYLIPLQHNGAPTQEKDYLTDALSDGAVRFVNEASKKQKPFFLYLAYNAPHTPLEAKEEDMQKFSNIKDKARRTYAGMVYALDRGVGELVAALKATNQYDNTLIVFLSDNGGRTDQGANNFPLRGVKGDTFEGGFRVPMFFHWPNHIPAGKTYSHPVTALDFYPTFADLAKAAIPKNKKLDGKNIWKNLVNGSDSRKGEMIFAMRHRSGFSDVGVRQDEWKATKGYNSSWKLYNINEDMGEKNDLSQKYPEQLKLMVLEAEKWSKKHTEPLWFDPEELSKVWKEKDMASFPNTFKIAN
ncbi:sulfatase-like hydrolase/transferase [Flavobacterium sp. UMI-01]|uniref:sulfatase-like hydrolase/transferase n=1 Tax=Flavobacterium sp. UMI-01 TaxID=1441053 RepID=UPI001C7D2661|nr:sulfatase-like hydrolase/transferase [Flavobacterium sp. UMI-01]GIZ08867.1 arylsulfatase [Flavobacterium sp. UMI-01]